MPSDLRSQTLRDVDELEPVLAGQSILRRGDRGEAVHAMQNGLLALGYALRGGADGIFGPSTEDGLEEFRRLNGHYGPAVLDAVTLAELDDALFEKEQIEQYTLQNGRFAGDTQLTRVVRGQAPLPRSGAAVRKVQQALHDMQFSLPHWGVDGYIGKETNEAIRRFQRWQNIRPGGELTSTTMMRLDQKAPPPGQEAVVYPEYGHLIRNGVLTVTLGLGYDESDLDLRELRQIEQGLRDAGFAHSGSTSESAVQIYSRSLSIAGRSGRMRLRLVSRHTHDPENEFADGLIHDAITIYSGHARYGTGPDFDHIDSPAENFVIGIGAPEHRRGRLTPGYNPHMNQILAGVPNDLLTRRFDPERSQLWAFLGCTTRHYLDELRVLIDGKHTHNLDLVVSTRPLYWRDGDTFSLSIIDSLLRGKSINDLLREANRLAKRTETAFGESHSGDAFIGDGFGDNRTS